MPARMLRFFRHIPAVEARAAFFSVFIGVALLAVKFLAYALTGSAAIFSDAMESIVNVAASGVAITALAIAHRPADAEHPYGHGKVEFLSAGFEGGAILLASLVIMGKAALAFFSPELRPEDIGLGLTLMTMAMLVNGTVGLMLIRTGRIHHSITLEADGYHLLSDAITSVVAVGALLIYRAAGWQHADPIGAMLIALYIGWTGFGLMRRAVYGLMDRQDIADEQVLRQILDAHVGPDGKEPRISSYHKLRHRHSGRYHWVDFHIMVPAEMSVQKAHEIASVIEYEIELALGIGNATAHIEPCQPDACNVAPPNAASARE